MRHFVLLQGLGNNERGWARLMSEFGRVTLVQLGMVEHVEQWERGLKTFDGPTTSLVRRRFLDEISFSTLTFFRSLRCFRKHLGAGVADLVIAGNYSQGLPALWLRRRGKAKRVVVLVSDYLPIRGTLPVRLHRRITAALSRFAVKRADEVWSVSPRIPFMMDNPKHFVVPICIDDHKVPLGKREEIGYIGVPTPDHALEILFEICARHKIRLNIVGDSPYLSTIKNLAPDGTVFHGMISDAARISTIMSRCFCGYAVYRNTGPEGYSYYGIPSKTFAYFASNTPTVTTNTAYFTTKIQEFGIGRVVEPESEQIEAAILQLRDGFEGYYTAISDFRTKWNAGATQFHRDRLEALGILE